METKDLRWTKLTNHERRGALEMLRSVARGEPVMEIVEDEDGEVEGVEYSADACNLAPALDAAIEALQAIVETP